MRFNNSDYEKAFSRTEKKPAQATQPEQSSVIEGSSEDKNDDITPDPGADQDDGVIDGTE